MGCTCFRDEYSVPIGYTNLYYMSSTYIENSWNYELEFSGEKRYVYQDYVYRYFKYSNGDICRRIFLSQNYNVTLESKRKLLPRKQGFDVRRLNPAGMDKDRDVYILQLLKNLYENKMCFIVVKHNIKSHQYLNTEVVVSLPLESFEELFNLKIAYIDGSSDLHWFPVEIVYYSIHNIDPIHNYYYKLDKYQREAEYLEILGISREEHERENMREKERENMRENDEKEIEIEGAN